MMKQFFFGSGLWKKCGMLKRHPLPCTLVGWKVSDTPGRYSPDVAHPKVSFVILFHHVSPVWQEFSSGSHPIPHPGTQVTNPAKFEVRLPGNLGESEKSVGRPQCWWPSGLALAPCDFPQSTRTLRCYRFVRGTQGSEMWTEDRKLFSFLGIGCHKEMIEMIKTSPLMLWLFFGGLKVLLQIRFESLIITINLSHRNPSRVVRRGHG